MNMSVYMDFCLLVGLPVTLLLLTRYYLVSQWRINEDTSYIHSNTKCSTFLATELSGSGVTTVIYSVSYF